MIDTLTTLIRADYSPAATIIIRLDAGFFDQKIFSACDDLGVGFIATGKMYEGVKEDVRQIPESDWNPYQNERQTWRYAEWSYRAQSWETAYRAIYTQPVYEENGQGIIEFARPDNVVITNLGKNEKALQHCSPSQREELASARSIIGSHHQRGADELPHRGLKDFGTEKLPFKRFAPNAAYYYCLVIAFTLFECFKRDVIKEEIPALETAYPTTIRRKLIDIAGKIVRTARRVIVKVSRASWDALRFDRLWRRAMALPLVPL